MGLVPTAIATWKFIEGSHVAWFWLSMGLVAIVVATFWRFHTMRVERDHATEVANAAARGSISQTLVKQGEGAVMHAEGYGNQMVIDLGASTSARRRWSGWHRLRRKARANLAERLSALAQELFGWSQEQDRQRPQDADHAQLLEQYDMRTPEGRQGLREAERPYKEARERWHSELQSAYGQQFIPRIRVLVEEVLRAGYDVDRRFFQLYENPAGPYPHQKVAQELEAMAVRIRGSIRSPHHS